MDCEKMCEIKSVRQRVECKHKRVGALNGRRRMDCGGWTAKKCVKLRRLGH